ncbi:major royal jelly protein 5-like [Achroia grisella]|uniref:major royal jelly protein 5-like n=1 Tax=Achroia grisella TaxID=688607 RepID=UPI0027D3113F|nr:major royal jelly protein 5-like [Achroia grisella]
MIVFRLIHFVTILEIVLNHPNNLAWVGGPIHSECENGADFLIGSGQYIKEHVIVTKAVTFRDNIYVISPRFKHGILSTVWQLVAGRRGPELQAYPELSYNKIGDCNAIQNAVDEHLDHLGNLWILDTGVVEVLESPRCMCPPKVVVINTVLGKITKYMTLSSLTDLSVQLQSIVVEYELGLRPFVYISDPRRGAIIVYDVTYNAEWSVLACAPVTGLQLALMKRGANTILILVRLHNQGLLELDTATLRRKNSIAALRVFSEHSKRVVLLGFDIHHVYLRHAECADVLSWDARETYNASNLISIHSPGPRLTPTSVTADPLKQILIVLDSNYGDTVHSNLATYHRISYIGKI